MTPKEFVLKYKNAAFKASEANGINYLAILTQAAHESAWGANACGNNFFGIKKGVGWTGKTQLLRTTEYSIRGDLTFPEIISKSLVNINGIQKWQYKIRDYFRSYDTPEEGFLDHGNFLIRNKRYAEALKVKTEPIPFFIELAKAKYATDPNYSKRLITIYEKIKLNDE